MKKNNMALLLLLISLMLSSCGNQSKHAGDGKSFLDDCDVVATVEVFNGDTVIVCDFNKIRQRKNVPLDELLHDFTILKMDNEKDEGLIGDRLPDHIIGENHIAIFNVSSMPLKLYDRQGRYIRDIGRFGQGPGEYDVINTVHMDEKNDRIYVLTFGATNLLVYDFEGNTYPPIPLVESVNMGNSIIPDTGRERLIVTKSPRKGATYSVWVQDFQGNMLQGIAQSDYFSDDISMTESTLTRLLTPNIEYFWVGFRNTDEYLYNYSVEENRLIPKFRMKNMNEEATIFIFELPRHFIVEVGTHMSPGNDDYFTLKIIIDKKTRKGCHFDGFLTPEGILLDQYRILTTSYQGYFSFVDFGSYIEEKIERIEKDNLSAMQQEELKKLRLLIDETDLDDDCSLLLYGKFKQ